MPRAQVATHTADLLARADLRAASALVGFDGFVDAIIDVVSTRRSPADFDRVLSIPAFAQRCAAAAGKSTNMEIVVREERFGGNGPLMAGALAAIGAPTTFVGCVGRADAPSSLVHPLFADLALRCKATGGGIVPVAAPALTHALEFDDGKLMLNDPRNVQGVTWESLVSLLGLDGLRALAASARLVSVVNWVNMDSVRAILEGLLENVLPSLTPKPRLFIDLSDPARRSAADLRAVLATLTRVASATPLTLGLNLSEAQQVERACGLAGLDSHSPSPDQLRRAARAIRAHLALDTVVIHPREGAAAADTRADTWFEGPLCAKPRLSTGAGDHFNAGFALAQVLAMPLDSCCALGCAVSGAYVRDAQSPSRHRLVDFLRTLPAPDPA